MFFFFKIIIAKLFVHQCKALQLWNLFLISIYISLKKRRILNRIWLEISPPFSNWYKLKLKNKFHNCSALHWWTNSFAIIILKKYWSNAALTFKLITKHELLIFKMTTKHNDVGETLACKAVRSNTWGLY